MGVKRLPLKEFKKIYSKVTRLTVDAVVKTPEGVVLTKRSIDPFKGKWHIPGGTVLIGEKLEESVKRVAKEEVGLEVGIDKFLDTIYYEDIERKHGWPIGMVFLTYVQGGRIEKDENTEDIGVFKNIPKDIIKVHANLLKDKLSME